MPHSMWEKTKLCIPRGGVLSGWLVDHSPTVLPCNTRAHHTRSHCGMQQASREERSARTCVQHTCVRMLLNAAVNECARGPASSMLQS